MPPFTRAVVIVVDGAGIGALPDAAAYGDEGSNTLGNVARRVPLAVPVLRSLGLNRLVPLGGATPERPRGAYGRMIEVSAGKDSVTGHWELMGVVLERPFPTYPSGFPPDMIAEFERRIERATLGNTVASGTEIIERLGPEHMRTGKPIVYTSADSVFQIAAHEGVIPIADQYRMCETAFDLVSRGAGVGRVIARPFVGTPGAFARTANRHDYALDPTSETLLDRLFRHGATVVSIGKIASLFAGRGITRSVSTSSDADGLDKLEVAMADTPTGLIFVNLVDADSQYGHRNDVAGYAANLERFDEHLGRLLPSLRDKDLLVVTADHGNDPSTPSTDHSREYVPVLMTGSRVRAGVDLGTRATFADLGQTLADNFGVGPLEHGTSFLREIVEETGVEHP
ncbi:MAG: phosphopentomutase [Acidobacteria bacterium]|nr:phosphopentomutase [Acidobacteriota bacterium]